MAPRKRKPGNELLEPNLYLYNGYYKYRNPITKKTYGFGTDRAKANAAARKLNMQFADLDLSKMIARAENREIKLFKAVCDEYYQDLQDNKDLKASTLKNIKFKLEKYKKDDIGKMDVSLMDIGILKRYCEPLTRSAYIKHRALFIDIFKYAAEEQYCSENHALKLRAKTEKKQRARLSLEQYQAIHNNAEPWLQIAMDAALYSLQGRSEVCRIKHDDFQNNVFRVVREKTDKHEAAYLEITVPENSGLAEVFKRSRNTPPLCSFLVKRSFSRNRSQTNDLDHLSQVRPAFLSRAFAAARDKVLGKIKNPPTFHEIRSLGAYLYEKAGFDKKYVQLLMAHSDEAMTEYYQSGHEQKWIKCEAGLKL